MKRWTVGFAVLIVLLATHRLDGAIQWRLEDGGNGHYYELVDPGVLSRFRWVDAKVLAEESTYLGMNGHLATITSQAEHTFLWENVYSESIKVEHSAVWLGLTDNEDYGGFESVHQRNPQVDGWVWVTGESVSYVSWGPGEPNNYGGKEEDFA